MDGRQATVHPHGIADFRDGRAHVFYRASKFPSRLFRLWCCAEQASALSAARMSDSKVMNRSNATIGHVTEERNLGPVSRKKLGPVNTRIVVRRFCKLDGWRDEQPRDDG